MEQFLRRYILPELSSKEPLMRSRASWMYGAFGDLDFKDNDHIK